MATGIASEIVLPEADAAVEELASYVEVTKVAGRLLDHVHHDEAQVSDLVSLSLLWRPRGGVDSGVEVRTAFARST